jgi:hypothetical protein
MVDGLGIMTWDDDEAEGRNDENYASRTAATSVTSAAMSAPD